jgi:5-aminolevulinate synthase
LGIILLRNAGNETSPDGGKCPFLSSELGSKAMKQASAEVHQDIIELGEPSKETFPYESFFHDQIMRKKNDHSYRVFKKVNRLAENFPSAHEFSWGKRPITVWCSNDYLGMSCHPDVKQAVW